MKGMKKRWLSMLMAWIMIFSVMPTTALADSSLGTVQVIVENTTYKKASGAPWEGTLVDTKVDLTSDMTMMTAIQKALKDKSYSYKANSDGTYISEINGLAEFDGGSQSGWMGTLNDWFTNTSFADYKVSNNTLCDGDVIRVMYTSTGLGTDLGAGTYGNKDTALSALSVTGGTMDQTFAAGTKDYTVTVPGTTTAVKVNATAKYKSHQVYLYVGEKEYRRTAEIPVTNGMKISVQCGEKDIATTYTLTVKVEGQSVDTVPVTGVSVTPQTLSITTGNTYALTAKVTPENATDQTVNWTSSEESVATVAANGVVTAVAEGKTTITATTADGNYKASCTVTVTKPISIAMIIHAPAGSTISFGSGASYGGHVFKEAYSVTDTEDGVTAKFTLPTPLGTAAFYRVQHPDGVTYWNFGSWSEGTEITVTKDDLHIGDKDFTKSTVFHSFEENKCDVADVYLNINEKGYLPLNTGDTYSLRAHRNWQAIESFMNAQIAVPDVHYQVIDVNGNASDVVTIEPDADRSMYAELTAKKEGTAIVLVTYDAMTDVTAQGGSKLSAIWPENTGVFVVTVGADGSSVQTNMTINEGLNTTSGKVAGDNLDAEADVLYYVGEEGASYSFTPEKGCSVEILRPTLTSTSMTYTGGFNTTGITTDSATGEVTITDLTHGTNIVKVTKGDAVTYQLIRAKKAEVVIKDSDGNAIKDGGDVKAGETITITYNGIYNPAEKLAGIYNFTARLFYIGEDGTLSYNAEKAGMGSYNFGASEKQRTFTYTVSAFAETGTLTLNGGIGITAYGQPVGGHRGNRTGADLNADYRQAELGQLPTVTLHILGQEDMSACTFTALDGTSAVNNVTYTVENEDGDTATFTGTTTKLPAGKYTVKAVADGYVILRNAEIEVTEKGENKFSFSLEKAKANPWDGETFTKPSQDGNGVWQISTAEELYWYVKECNYGTIENYNAVLTADIELSGYEFPANTATLSGAVFDGQGHTIYHLYGTTTSAGAQYMPIPLGVFFNSLAGEVKNLTITGEYELYTKNTNPAGAINFGVFAGEVTGKITNCVNKVDVTVQNLLKVAAATAVGGFTGKLSGTISGSINEGDIYVCNEASAANGMMTRAAGIVAYGEGTVEQCANYGDITVVKSGAQAAGIVGYMNKGAVKSCYNVGNIDGKATFVSGIVGYAYNGSIQDCHNYGSVTSTPISDTYYTFSSAIAYARKSGTTVYPTFKNSYYLDTSVAEGHKGITEGGGTEGTAAEDSTGAYEAKTAAQFKSGEVANLLGTVYGQKLGVDDYPVFTDGTNQILLYNGTYYQGASAELVEKMIAAIGKVGLDGDSNCFGKTDDADTAYGLLSEEEQAKVSNANVLTAAKEAYTSAVNEVINAIKEIGTLTLESETAIANARRTYDKYIELGGDADRITNYGSLTTAETKYAQLLIAEDEKKVEATIEKKTIDEKEYFVITNAEQLIWFEDYTNGQLYSYNNKRNSTANMILGSDIVVNENLLERLAAKDYKEIPDDIVKINYIGSLGYTGTIDGNGHSIIGAYLNQGSFVRSIKKGGCVKNISFVDCFMEGTSSSGLVYMTAAGSSVEDITMTGVVNRGRNGVLANSLAGTMKNCAAEVTVINGDTWFMGIASTINGTAENCYVTATVDCIAATQVCGMASSAKGTIQNCYSYVTATGDDVIFYGMIKTANKGLTMKNNYFLKVGEATALTTGDVEGQAEGRTAAEFADGSVCKLLNGEDGTLYKQRIGIDKYPRFQSLIDMEVLAEAKANGIKTVQDYKNAEDYREVQQKELDAIIAEAVDAIAAATSTATVEEIVNTAKTKLDAVKTDAQLTEAEKRIEEIYKTTGNYLANAGTPEVGSIGGEWMVIGLARSGYKISDDYYERVVAYVNEHINEDGQLHKSKSTDNSRLILALTALGYDVTDVDGHNLLTALSSMSYVENQGLNGPIWALIALDSHGYEISVNADADDQTTREKLLNTILDAQLEDGGWTLYGSVGDVDMTAMALQALAPYYKKDEAVKSAVDRAIAFLSAAQNEDGAFATIGSTSATSESTAQVIVALAALSINPHTDERFIKNGFSAVDALAGFYVEGGGFKHVMDGSLNGMATEQGYYALTAYYRFLKGQTTLYDMSDVTIKTGTEEIPSGDSNNNGSTNGTDSSNGGTGAANSTGNISGSSTSTGDAAPIELMVLLAVISLGMGVCLIHRKRENE